MLIAVGKVGKNAAAGSGTGVIVCCCNRLPVVAAASVAVSTCTAGTVSGRVGIGCEIQVALFGGCRTCAPGCVVKCVVF